jgi:hypothetical protein
VARGRGLVATACRPAAYSSCRRAISRTALPARSRAAAPSKRSVGALESMRGVVDLSAGMGPTRCRVLVSINDPLRTHGTHELVRGRGENPDRTTGQRRMAWYTRPIPSQGAAQDRK